jgi:hypothetical protein
MLEKETLLVVAVNVFPFFGRPKVQVVFGRVRPEAPPLI